VSTDSSVGVLNQEQRCFDGPGMNWNVEFVSATPISLHPIRVMLQGTYAYVVESTYPDPTSQLTVISMSDPAHPEVKGSCGGFHFIYDLFVQGNYAYLPDFYATEQIPSRLYQVDISNPSHPSTAAYASVSGNARAVACQGSSAFVAGFSGGLSYLTIGTPGLTYHSQMYTNEIANEIFIQGNYAYIADYGFDSSSDYLTVVDISNPSSLHIEGAAKLAAGNNHIPVGVWVQGNYAYVADRVGLQIYNVSNPAHPTTVRRYGDDRGCYFVEVSGKYAYLIVDYGIEILNISTPSTPRLVGHYGITDVSGLTVRDDLIFAASWDGGLQVLRFTGQDEGWPNPPQTPVGPSNGERHVAYEFVTNATDPHGDQVFYQWSWGDGSVSAWDGPYDSGETVTGTNAWNEPGNWSIQVHAKNNLGRIGDWSEPHTMTILNKPPTTPRAPSGPSEGVIITAYEFSTNATDPDNDTLKYGWDWDNDGYVEEWSSSIPSGDLLTISHYWVRPGSYVIRVKASDPYNAMTNWSDPFIITISGPALEIGDVRGGVGVSAQIRNIGNLDAEHINYTFRFHNGIILFPPGRTSSGSSTGIQAGEDTKVKTSVFGLGPLYVIVEAEIPCTPPVVKTVAAFIFGPFVVVR